MSDNPTEDSRIIHLMAKKLGKNISAEELLELNLLLNAHPSYTFLGEIVTSLKGSPEHFEKNIPVRELADSGWKHLAGRLSQNTSKGDESVGDEVAEPLAKVLSVKTTRIWKVAVAAMVLIAGASFSFYYHNNKMALQAGRVNKSLNVRYGSQKMLILEDGTRIWLNAGSHLVYPTAFSGATREVELEGEAFFDVAARASMPFLVHAGKITVKVLGTRFNVKAYKEDANITTTLISGKVQVMMDNDPEKKIILSPHEKLMVVNSFPGTDHSGNEYPHSELRYQVQSLPSASGDSLAETAWMENKLVISDETFDQVALLLERKYDVHIDFGSEALKEEHLSGVFENETLQQVLDILRMTTRFHYTIEGKKVLLAKGL